MPELEIIAHIRTDFPEKFGIPRQSGLVPELRGKIIFQEKYRRPEAFRGLEEFSHIWILWQFSQALRQDWTLCPASKIRWKCEKGRICHPLPLPAQRNRPVLRETGCHQKRERKWHRPLCIRNRHDGWHAHLRHQALPLLCGQQARRLLWICRSGRAGFAHREHPCLLHRKFPGRKAICPDPSPGTGSQTRISD